MAQVMRGLVQSTLIVVSIMFRNDNNTSNEKLKSYFDRDIGGIPKDYYLPHIAKLEIDLANHSTRNEKLCDKIIMLEGSKVELKV